MAVREQMRYQGEGRAVAYQLAALAGLRYSEVKTLLWGDIDFGRAPARLTIRAENAKARREDTVPISQSLAAELLAWRDRVEEATGRRPCQEDTVVHVGSRFRGAFKKDCEAAGIKVLDKMGRHVDMHALRHTYAQMLAQANVHPKVAQHLLRHTDIRLTMAIYTHHDETAEARAVEALPDVSGREVGSTSGTDFGSTSRACDRTTSHGDAQAAEGQEGRKGGELAV